MHAIRKWRAFGVALALTFGVGFAWAQQSSVGGLTSRPRFTTVAVGAPNSGLAVGELYTTGGIATDGNLIAALGIETDEGGVFIAGDDHTPSVILVDENEAGDNRAFRITPNGGDLSLQACADGAPVGACSSAVTITRTGSTVDSVNLQATAVQINGAPISWGTYTPTLTGINNVAASTARVCQWMRVGNTVTVSGQVSVDPTAADTVTTIRMTIPVASNFTTANEGLAGAGYIRIGTTHNDVSPIGIVEDTANDAALLDWVSPDAAAGEHQFTFTYRVQ